MLSLRLVFLVIDTSLPTFCICLREEFVENVGRVEFGTCRAGTVTSDARRLWDGRLPQSFKDHRHQQCVSPCISSACTARNSAHHERCAASLKKSFFLVILASFIFCSSVALALKQPLASSQGSQSSSGHKTLLGRCPFRLTSPQHENVVLIASLLHSCHTRQATRRTCKHLTHGQEDIEGRALTTTKGLCRS